MAISITLASKSRIKYALPDTDCAFSAAKIWARAQFIADTHDILAGTLALT